MSPLRIYSFLNQQYHGPLPVIRRSSNFKVWLQMSVKVGWIFHVWILLGNSSLLGPACLPKHWRLEVVSRTDGYPLSALTDEKWQSLEVKAFPNLNCLLCSLNKAVIHLKKLWALTCEKPLTRDKCSVSAIGCSKSPDVWYGSTFLIYIRFLHWHDLFWPKEARCAEVCAFCRKLRSLNFLERNHFINYRKSQFCFAS